MGNLRLEKLYVKNFKLFGEPYSVAFGNASLTVLDGPNGYGKTSIFDAIELALTGTIKRFYTIENKQVPADVVVAHKGNADVEVVLELSGEKPFTIIRRLKQKLPSRSTRTDNFGELWDLFVVANGKEEKVTNEQLWAKLHNANIMRDYHLLHYVQQEETAHFLKSNKEHQRAEALSSLLGDTKEAQDEVAKIDFIMNKIKSCAKAFSLEEKDLEVRYDIKNGSIPKLGTEQPHHFLFPWLQGTARAPEWDGVTVADLSHHKKERIASELHSIKCLLLHRDTFLSERIYRLSAQQTEVLHSFLQYGPFLDDVNALRYKASLDADVTHLTNTLKSRNFDEVRKVARVNELLVKCGYVPGDFFRLLQELLEARKQDTGLSLLYRELIRYRVEMEKKLLALGAGEQCPFCGTSYPNSATLVDAISNTGIYYQALLSDQGKKLQKMEEDFEKGVLEPLLELLLKFKSDLDAPAMDFIAGIEGAEKMQDRLTKLRSWLVKEEIAFLDLCADSPTLLNEAERERRCSELASRIRAKSPTIDQDYLESDAGGGFDRVFSAYFDRSPDLLRSIAVGSLESKLIYIDNIYFNSLGSVIERHRVVRAKINDLDAKLEKLKSIKMIMQKQIRAFQLKLITDIEIPFHIYSAKVLQAHQAGTGGIFIKDPTNSDELKNVRLVSDWRTDHDILNTMSSGQISAVVIALSLALNKVYSKGLDTILIDDPVQTMDDINMISLVELLRNEFQDKQILLSTHEEDVSRYLLYKFLKHGHAVKKVNLMERKEYVLEN